MKKLLFALLITTRLNAQVKFIDREYKTFSIAIDPSASSKENGLNINAELQLVSYWKYVKVSTQLFTALEGGYLDFGGGFGTNLKLDRFDKTRVYTGIRLGLIKRGFNTGNTETYPLAGFEGGFDYHLTDSFFIGVKATGDYRSDFKFSGANPSMRYSSFVRLGYKF